MWQTEQPDICEGCGQPLSETLDEKNFEAYSAYALRCQGCKAIADTATKFDDRAGLRYRVTKREGVS